MDNKMLKEQLNADLKTAMLAKDRVRTGTLRMLRAAMLEKEIELREGGKADVSDEIVLSVVQKQAKQRRDSIDQYVAAGREDLAQNERAELQILEEYLPKQLSENQIRREVSSVIDEMKAESMKDMGRVMGAAMNRLKGVADGRMVQTVVKEMLAS